MNPLPGTRLLDTAGGTGEPMPHRRLCSGDSWSCRGMHQGCILQENIMLFMWPMPIGMHEGGHICILSFGFLGNMLRYVTGGHVYAHIVC